MKIIQFTEVLNILFRVQLDTFLTNQNSASWTRCIINGEINLNHFTLPLTVKTMEQKAKLLVEARYKSMELLIPKEKLKQFEDMKKKEVEFVKSNLESNDCKKFTQIIDKMENGAEEKQQKKKQKKGKMEVGQLLALWKKHFVISEDEYTKILAYKPKEIGNIPAEASQSVCIGILLEWQEEHLMHQSNTFKVIPYLERLEKIWSKTKVGSFVEFLQSYKIYVINDIMIEQWKLIQNHLLCYYPFFIYLTVDIAELALYAKDIKNYLALPENKIEAEYWNAYYEDADEMDIEKEKVIQITKGAKGMDLSK
jgi:hypothetical protein